MKKKESSDRIKKLEKGIEKLNSLEVVIWETEKRVCGWTLWRGKEIVSGRLTDMMTMDAMQAKYHGNVEIVDYESQADEKIKGIKQIWKMQSDAYWFRKSDEYNQC